MGGSAIRTRQLTKHFGAVQALVGVDLEVPAGSVLGLLGHNGAGKTTLIQILSTVLPPSGGSAEVAGFDIVRDARRVRACIGVTGQFAALDEHLSGLANLVLISRLLGARPREARRRAAELVEQFGLTEAADRPMRTYSGGMRRRIDLAASLVARPSVLFLDEPTTGLDPVSRTALWETVEGLVAEGTTVLLTTQYLDEADRLADRIAVLSSGHVVTVGTAAELKAAGTRSVRLTFGPRRIWRARKERCAWRASASQRIRCPGRCHCRWRQRPSWPGSSGFSARRAWSSPNWRSRSPRWTTCI